MGAGLVDAYLMFEVVSDQEKHKRNLRVQGIDGSILCCSGCGPCALAEMTATCQDPFDGEIV